MDSQKKQVVIRYTNYPQYCGGIIDQSVGDSIERLRKTVINGLNIPERYKKSMFGNFDVGRNLDTIKKLKDVIDDHFKIDNKPVSVSLWSNDAYGVGKTHLLYAMVNELILSDKSVTVTENGNNILVNYKAPSVLVISEYELINKIRKTFGKTSDITEPEIIDEINSYQVLGIDDVAKYTPFNMDFYRRVMFNLIDTRYKHDKSVIITTNKKLLDLGEFFGDAISDRLYEMTDGYCFEIFGKSHRVK